MTVRAMNYADDFFFPISLFIYFSSLWLNALSKYKQKGKRKKKKGAIENRNRFNFRYGKKAKWLQCKEERFADKMLLSADRNEAPGSPEAAIYYLQGSIGVGDGPESWGRVSGAPTALWGRWGDAGVQGRMGSLRGDKVVWLQNPQISPVFLKKKTFSDRKESSSFWFRGLKDFTGALR